MSSVMLVLMILMPMVGGERSVRLILHPPRPELPGHADAAGRWARKVVPWMLLILSAALTTIGVHALVAGSRVDGDALRLWRVAATYLSLQLAFIYLVSLTGPSADMGLTVRCRRLARRLGVRLRRVKVSQGVIGRNRIHSSVATVFAWTDVVLSRRLVEILSAEELDFICAYRLAQVKLRPSSAGGSNEVTAPAALSAGSILVCLAFPGIGASLAPFRIPIIAYLSALLAGACMMDRDMPGRRDIPNQAEADRLALQTVGRLDIAESCLGKLVDYNDVYDEHEIGKHIPVRIAALREAAMEMGMISPGESAQE